MRASALGEGYIQLAGYRIQNKAMLQLDPMNMKVTGIGWKTKLHLTSAVLLWTYCRRLSMLFE